MKMKLLATLRRVTSDETGAVAIEYGLLASLIAIAIITAAQTIGTKLVTVFGQVGNALT